VSTIDTKTVEQRLCELFAEVLGIADVRAQDSFFDLGGHSLTASKLARRAGTEFGFKVPMKRIYDAPTPELLAKELANLMPKGD
jgi:acyl carrier protein